MHDYEQSMVSFLFECLQYIAQQVIRQDTNQYVRINAIFFLVRIGPQSQVALERPEPGFSLRETDIQLPKLVFIQCPFVRPQHIATKKIGGFLKQDLLPFPGQPHPLTTVCQCDRIESVYPGMARMDASNGPFYLGTRLQASTFNAQVFLTLQQQIADPIKAVGRRPRATGSP